MNLNGVVATNPMAIRLIAKIVSTYKHVKLCTKILYQVINMKEARENNDSWNITECVGNHAKVISMSFLLELLRLFHHPCLMP
jgi:hypothetical protein